MRNRFLLLPLLSLVLGALWGCGAGGQDNGVKVPLPRQGLVRVVNVIPDSGDMTSFLSSTLFNVNRYGEASALVPELVGQYVMNILLTPPSNVNTVLVDNDPVNLTDQDEFSFFMIGPSASPQLVRVNNIDIAFDVDPSKPSLYPPPDFQILHGATATAAADVYVTDALTDITAVAPTATVNFGDVTPLIQQNAAITYRLRVTPAGSKTVLFDSGAFNVVNLKRSVYLLLDNYGPSGVELRVANVTAVSATNFPNQTLASTLRASNMIPDAPVVDIYLGDTTGVPLFTNVAYGTTTAYIPVANGAGTINITPPGTPGTIIATGAFTVVGGQALSLYASGLDATNTTTFGAVTESQRSISGQAQFRFVSAAPSAVPIDVYVVTPGQSIADSAPILANAPLLASDTVNLTPGSYDIFITRAGTSVQLFGPERISVDAGNVYSAVLIDAPGGGSPLTIQFTQEVLP